MAKKQPLPVHICTKMLGAKMKAALTDYIKKHPEYLHKSKEQQASSIFRKTRRTLDGWFNGDSLNQDNVDFFCTKLNIEFNSLINTSAIIQHDYYDYSNIVSFYFSGNDIAMLVRFVRTLREKNFLNEASIEVNGFYTHKHDNNEHLFKGTFVECESNGYRQTITINIDEQTLTLGGYFAILEDISCRNIIIHLPKKLAVELRDTLFILYTNVMLSIDLNTLKIETNYVRHILTQLKKHRYEQEAFSFLITHINALEYKSFGDYSAFADAFGYFSHIATAASARASFEILTIFFYKCIELKKDLKDAEYCLNAISCFVKQHEGLHKDFLMLCNDIFDNDINNPAHLFENNKKSHNINLLIYVTATYIFSSPTINRVQLQRVINTVKPFLETIPHVSIKRYM